MMTTHDVFWLARYAHNQLAPLFEQAKLVEPTTSFNIIMNFGDVEAYSYRENSLEVYSHWGRDGMFQMTTRLKNKAALDLFIAKLRKDVEKLQADALADALMVL